MLHLHWDKIDGYMGDDGWGNTEEGAHPLTVRLGHLMMNVGINRITEANVETFYERLLLVQFVLNGVPMHTEYDAEKGPNWYVIPFEDVYRRIGLSSNATTYTDAKFRKLISEHIELEARRATNRAKRRMQEATTT